MFIPESENAFKVYEQKNAIQKDASLGRYYITQEKFDELKGFAVAPGDIIVSCAGTIGETYVLPNDCKDGIINQALMIIRLFRPEILEYYLEYFNFVLKASATKDSKGTAIKNIPPFEILKAYPFPLPPIAEQQRIVEATKQFDRLFEMLNKNRDQIVNRITRIKAKILDIAMQGKLVPQDPTDEPASDMLLRINPKAKIITDNPHLENIPQGWCKTDLKSIGKWQSGATPSKLNAMYYGKGYPWLNTGDLNDGLINSIPKEITALALKETSVKLNPIGSVLIAMYGATIGKLGILGIESTTNQACCACANCFIYNKFLFYFLLFYRPRFIQLGGGGAQPNISKEKIETTFILLPPLNEQKRIVAKLEGLYSVLDEIGASLQS